jgi:hypothetical protein
MRGFRTIIRRWFEWVQGKTEEKVRNLYSKGFEHWEPDKWFEKIKLFLEDIGV